MRRTLFIGATALLLATAALAAPASAAAGSSSNGRALLRKHYNNKYAALASAGPCRRRRRRRLLASSTPTASASAVAVQNMDVYAHPDLNLILGTVTVANNLDAPLPCDGLEFELLPKAADAQLLRGPLACPGQSVAAGATVECGFAAQAANAQAYASAGASFDDEIDAASADAVAFAVADGNDNDNDNDLPLCPDESFFVHHGSRHHNRPPCRKFLLPKPMPILFRRPPPLFPKYGHLYRQHFSVPPPPKLELCADALAQAFGDDAWGMTFAKADSCCRDRADTFAVATAVVEAKFSVAVAAPYHHDKPAAEVVAPPPPPKVVEKLVYVEKPVEKIVYKDKIVEKPVEKIVYRDRVIERPGAEKVVYRDNAVPVTVPAPPPPPPPSHPVAAVVGCHHVGCATPCGGSGPCGGKGNAVSVANATAKPGGDANAASGAISKTGGNALSGANALAEGGGNANAISMAVAGKK